MRNKYVSNEEAVPILQYSGLPVELVSGSMLQCFQNLPLFSRVYTSAMQTQNEHWFGVEVYRDASNHPEATSGFVHNQDLYSGHPVVNGYVITGPFYDAKNHWAKEIPQYLVNAPVINPENKTE